MCVYWCTRARLNTLYRVCRQAPLASGFLKTRPNCPCPIAFLSRTHGIKHEYAIACVYMFVHMCTCAYFICFSSTSTASSGNFLSRIEANKTRGCIKCQNRSFPIWKSFLNGSPFDVRACVHHIMYVYIHYTSIETFACVP